MRQNSGSRSLGSCFQEKDDQSLANSLTSRDKKGYSCNLWPPYLYQGCSPFPEHQVPYLNISMTCRKATSSRKPSLNPPSQLPDPASDCPGHWRVPTGRWQSLLHSSTQLHPKAGPKVDVKKALLLQGGSAGELWRLCLWLGDKGWGVSPGKLTCLGVFETGGPQDVNLGHLLGIATQRAPAGAGRLIQTQFPGAGQRRRGGR